MCSWRNSASPKSALLQLSTNIEILLNMQPQIPFRTVMLTLAISLGTDCPNEARKTPLLREADHSFKAGYHDKAKESHIKVIQLQPQHARAFERLGAMWQDDGAPPRARAFLPRTSELDPKNIQNRV